MAGPHVIVAERDIELGAVGEGDEDGLAGRDRVARRRRRIRIGRADGHEGSGTIFEKAGGEILFEAAPRFLAEAQPARIVLVLFHLEA